MAEPMRSQGGVYLLVEAAVAHRVYEKKLLKADSLDPKSHPLHLVAVLFRGLILLPMAFVPLGDDTYQVSSECLAYGIHSGNAAVIIMIIIIIKLGVLCLHSQCPPNSVRTRAKQLWETMALGNLTKAQRQLGAQLGLSPKSYPGLQNKCSLPSPDKFHANSGVHRAGKATVFD